MEGRLGGVLGMNRKYGWPEPYMCACTVIIRYFLQGKYDHIRFMRAIIYG